MTAADLFDLISVRQLCLFSLSKSPLSLEHFRIVVLYFCPRPPRPLLDPTRTVDVYYLKYYYYYCSMMILFRAPQSSLSLSSTLLFSLYLLLLWYYERRVYFFILAKMLFLIMQYNML